MPVNMESKYRAAILYYGGSPVSESNRLPVDAQLTVGDIEIGAVEIKNHDSDVRASVVAGATYNAIVTIDHAETGATSINLFTEKSINGFTEDTLVTFTVPAGKKFFVTGIIVGGNADGKFTLKAAGSKLCIARNSATKKTMDISFPERSESNAAESQVVEILCYNEHGATRAFEGTLLGYTKNT